MAAHQHHSLADLNTDGKREEQESQCRKDASVTLHCFRG